MMDADDRLKLEFEQTTQLLRSLADIRFRMLAVVPTFAGAAVGFFGRPRPAAELLAVGVLGLAATLGIFIHELRNSQLYATAQAHARVLERRLELPGLLLDSHDRGVALVYGAALAGWSYLVAWGLFRAVGFAGAQKTGLGIGAAVGVLIVVEAKRLR